MLSWRKRGTTTPDPTLERPRSCQTTHTPDGAELLSFRSWDLHRKHCCKNPLRLLPRKSQVPACNGLSSLSSLKYLREKSPWCSLHVLQGFWDTERSGLEENQAKDRSNKSQLFTKRAGNSHKKAAGSKRWPSGSGALILCLQLVLHPLHGYMVLFLPTLFLCGDTTANPTQITLVWTNH